MLKRQALAHKGTVMVGRTHGIHAEPYTLGLKFTGWYLEARRNRERLSPARSDSPAPSSFDRRNTPPRLP